MSDFPLRVWAPDAERVEGVVGGRRIELASVGGGWWLSDETLSPGTDYKFSLDGGDALPSPRSRFQPDGVNGPSRIVDPGAFEWHDAGFRAPPLASAVIYELHIGTFTAAGTFESAIEHLDHIVSLGATHIELMPVAEFSGDRGWGYDGVDLYAPHRAYGGPEGLARLVDAAHARGLAVILDVVYNHLGPAGNYLPRFGSYFTDRYGTPWGSAVNLDDAQSDEVRRFFIDNALMWLRDYHFDALRLDAVHAIHDESAVHFLEELADEVHSLAGVVGRDLAVIAESDLNDPRLIRSAEAGGYGLDAQWSDDFHHALHSVLTGERSGYYEDFGSFEDLAVTLVQGYRYAGDYSPFRQRRHGRPHPDLDGRRLLGYLQNHDQVGNRALGERSAALMSTGRVLVGAAVVLLAPFVPMLFQGEEWAASTPFQYFTDHRDAQLGAAVSKGRRDEFAAFGWDPENIPDPQSVETFERSRLRWDEVTEGEHARVLEWHCALIALRRRYPDLTDGRLEMVGVEFDEDQRWMTFERGRVTVAFNLGEMDARVAVNGRNITLASGDGVRFDGDDLVLPPDAVGVIVSS
jgi:maltooligosyltrehalose trehalohydrolase